MLKKNIKYTDYNGVERDEQFMFHLTKAELMEMEMGTTGGLAEQIQRIVESQDSASIIKIFKDDKEHDLTITLFGIFKITIKKHR